MMVSPTKTMFGLDVQLSVAVGVPGTGTASQFTVRSEGTKVKTGFVRSCTVMIWKAVFVFPQSSWADQVLFKE